MKNQLTIDHTEDYLDIYKGDEVLVSWSKDEWMEDPETVVPAMVNAVILVHTNPKELIKKLKSFR